MGRIHFRFGILVLILLGSGLLTNQSAHAAATYSAVPVSNGGTDNSLAYSNTARKVAVGSNGYIYVTYHGDSQGVRIARSINRGVSFESSIQLDTVNAEAEVAVDQNDNVYVTWISDGNIKLAKSANGGVSFSTAVTVGGTGTCRMGAPCVSVHMAVSYPYVYIVKRDGTTLFTNSNGGTGSFTSVSIDDSRVFADVHVNPSTGYVYVQTDDPNVLYFVSTDHGQTFSTATATSTDVYYSTSALTSGDNGRYLYIGGGRNIDDDEHLDFIRINLADDSIFHIHMSDTDIAGQRTRSLATDTYGNLISAFTTDGVTKYEVSTDKGVSFNSAVTVTDGGYMSVAINQTTGDIVAAYESDGIIRVSVYQNELAYYSVMGAASRGGGVDPAMFVIPNAADISFGINDGGANASSASVVLHIGTGADVKTMAVSNSADFAGVSIQPLATTLPWILCDQCQAGQTYTVFLKLYTSWGQSITLSRNITYAPEATMLPVNTARVTASLFTFQTNLKLGSTNPDVIKLQQYLNSHGFVVATKGAGSAGQEIALFGNATKKALMKLQAAHPDLLVTPYGLTAPSGNFAAATRSYVNNNL